ncbi:MAG: FkbM family methyltransferase [Myxococcota bacterium]
MRIRSNGRSRPSQPLRLLQRVVTGARGSTRVDVESDGYVYSFVCNNLQTLRRATTLLIKEPGTIRWLRKQAKPGRVFLDIGANVGVYSIFSGHHIGPEGHVYSVEPHLRNAVALMENVIVNQLDEQVSVLCMALSRDSSVTEFRYREWGTGSSHSQLQNGDSITLSSPSVATELKSGTSIDILIADETIRVPDFIKIDVDGIELAILEGASVLLLSSDRPGSIQVEVEASNFREIDTFMCEHGYELIERHATMAGAKRIARGAVIEDLPHNVIYEPRDGG